MAKFPSSSLLAMETTEHRRGFLLDLTLLSLVVIATWAEIVALATEADPSLPALPLYAAGLFFALFVAFFVMAKRGRSALVSYLIVALLLSGALLSTNRWGAGHPVALLGDALAIIISSVLLGGRASVVVAIAAIVALASTGTTEISAGVLPEWKLHPLSMADVGEYVVFLTLLAGAARFSDKEIRRSLSRAKASEKALKAERDSLEKRVAERTAELKALHSEKMAELYRFVEFGRLSSGILHDLMNPLTSVIGGVGALEDALHPDVPYIKQSLAQASIASKRMERLIAAAKKQIVPNGERGSFELEREIEETLSLFRYESLKAGVRLSFSRKGATRIYGCPAKMQQALSNLVSNAIDSYASAPERKSLPIEISVRRDGGRAVMTVRDRGCGISEKNLGRIFDPFFTTKPLERGLGLGLSTTKEIAEKGFGGTLSASSVEGEGSTFVMTIPLERAHDRQAPAKPGLVCIGSDPRAD